MEESHTAPCFVQHGDDRLSLPDEFSRLFPHAVNAARLAFLVWASVYLGRSAWVDYKGAKLHPNLFGLAVGCASTTAYAIVRSTVAFFDGFDGHSLVDSTNIHNSFSLVFSVRDALSRPAPVYTGRDAHPRFEATVYDEGTSERRRLLMPRHFGGSLSNSRQASVSLRQTLSDAWLGIDLAVPLQYRDGAMLRSTAPHIGLFSACTAEEVARIQGLRDEIIFVDASQTKLGEWTHDPTLVEGYNLLRERCWETLRRAPRGKFFVLPQARRIISERLGLRANGCTLIVKALKIAMCFAVFDESQIIREKHMEQAVLYLDACAGLLEGIGSFTMNDAVLERAEARVIRALESKSEGRTGREISRILGNNLARGMMRVFKTRITSRVSITRESGVRGKPREIWRLKK